MASFTGAKQTNTNGAPVPLARPSVRKGSKSERPAGGGALVERRSQRLKQEIGQLKSCIPASLSDEQQQQQQSAPLASLELSISAEQPAATSCTRAHDNLQTTSVDSTPSLTGYLDCDELSDMVDDSLFEITAVGCLSRSIFPRDQKATAKTTTTTTVDKPAEKEEEATTATNEAPTSGHQQPVGGHFMSTKNICAGQQVSSMMAQFQSPDCSATSSVPRAIRNSIAVAAGSLTPPPDGSRKQQQQQQQQRISITSRRTERHHRHTSSSEDDGDKAIGQRRRSSKCPVCLQQVGQRIMASRKKQAAPKSRGFTSSLLSFFKGSREQQQQHQVDCVEECALLCQLHKRAPPARVANVAHTTPRRTENWNGATGSNQVLEQHKIKMAAANEQQRRPATSRATKVRDHHALPAVRLRDSIKITNQRKLRNAANGPGGAREADKKQRQQQIELADGEVLLDLSRGLCAGRKGNANTTTRQPAAKLNNTNNNASQSDCRTSRPKRAARGSSDSSSLVSASSNSTTAPPSGRQIKCVKFNTPDRVMILSPELPLDSSSSHPATRRRHPLPGSGSYSSGLTAAAAEVGATATPAPIMKRPAVPKSSSYSQTEPNQGLDELLARYEQNNQLVAEINEKLQLTDTIASNLSALDQVEQAESSGEPSGQMERTDEIPLDRDELLQRHLEIIEASHVFGWRPEDETQPATTASTDPPADLLERETASRCECNRSAREQDHNSASTSQELICPDQISDLNGDGRRQSAASMQPWRPTNPNVVGDKIS